MAVAAATAIASVVGMAYEEYQKLPPSEKKKIRDAIKKGNKALAKRIAKASRKKLKLPFAHSPAEYPKCAGKEGMAMVKCLISAIKRDKSIPKYMKLRRLSYLIALNKKQSWAGMKEVRKAVANARKSVKGARYPKTGKKRKPRGDDWL